MQLFRPTRTNPTPASRCKAWLAIPVVVLSLSTALFSRPAAAQTGQQFAGHIADPSGGSIAGATVTIHNEATGEDVVTKTTGAGDYTVPYLKPGTYTVTATLTGFKTVSKTHITLSVDQNSKMDFTLPVGAVTESVTVSSEGAQIELSKADRGEIIGNERVEEMPSDGRNYMVLFGLSPGTNNTSNPQYPRQQDNVSNNLHVQGVPQATVQQNLDGGTNDAGANNWSSSNVPMDTIAEFKVVLNPYDASYGRAGGGAVDVALKSGTNNVHGSLYEFARRGWLDGQSYQYDYLKTQPGSTVPVPDRHKRDQFGIEVDGPVYIPHIYNGKDRTFFTAQWEQAYEDLPSTGGNYNSIPDPNWTTGNFGSTPSNPLGIQYYDTTTKTVLPLGIYDPLQPLLPQVVDPIDGKKKDTRQQFPNGNTCGGPQGTLNNPLPNPAGTTVVCIIPQNRIDPVAKAIAQFYNTVTPNVGPAAGFAPYTHNQFFLPVETDISRNGLFKLDQNFGSRDRGTLRWTGFERLDQSSPNGLPNNSPINSNFDSQVQPKEQQYSIEEIHTFSPNLILDNKLTGGTQEQGIHNGFSGFNLTSLGFSQHYITNVLVTNYFPNIAASGYIGLAGGGTQGASAVHNLAYQPSVTWNHGHHTFRAGLDMRLFQYANINNVQNNKFGFGNTFTQHFTTVGDAPGMTSGNSLAELLLGYPNSGSLTFQSSPFFSQHYYGIWAQDDWKITPKLTLNMGVRYDLLAARTERHNQLDYGFDTTDVNTAIDSQVTDRSNLPPGPIRGGTLFAGVNGAPRGAYATNLLNIQPRFGVAYAFSSRTSLRAGFGEEFINDEATDHNNGFSAQTNFNSSPDGNITPALNNPCGVQSPTCNPCAPGAVGCNVPVAPGNTLADPYASTIKATNASLGLDTTPGSSINFTNPNFKVPSLWQYSVSLEQLLTKHDTLDISYSGLKSFNLAGSDDINHVPTSTYAQCDLERGGNPNLCNGNAALVHNPFQGNTGFPTSSSYYKNSTILYENLQRPFPEFTSVTEDHLPQIHSWYNSLQVTLGHNVSQDLSLHLAYTWSKTMTAGTLIDTVNRVYGRSRGSNDIPNAVTFSAVYYLPVGRGKTFLGHTNRVVDAVVGGWEVSPLYVYTQWYPWTPGNNFEIMSPIAVKIHDLPADANHSYKRLQGVSPCVGYKDPTTGVITPGPGFAAGGCTAGNYALVRQTTNGGSNVFASNFAVQQNINYTGVRLPANHQFDVSVSKRFAWSERANLQLRLDAFNALNHPNWNYGSSYSNDPTSDNFGTIRKGPDSPFGSLPRDLQISGKITF